MEFVKTREDLGARNRRLVLSEILLHGPLPRAVIAERVGLTQASVSRITRGLLDTGLIEEGTHFSGASGRGRKFVGLAVRPDGGYVAAIAINVFRQDVVIADLANNEVAQQSLQFSNLESSEAVLRQCAAALNALIDKTGISRNRFLCCGVAITGAVDPSTGTLREAPVLGWSDVDIEKIIQPVVGLPLVVESIANAKNLAAHCFGPTRGFNNIALFNASLAVGSSLFIDGRLLRGADSGAGLIETMRVPEEATGKLMPVDQVAGGLAVIDAGPFPNHGQRNDLGRSLMEVIEDAAAGNIDYQKKLTAAGRGLGFVIGQCNAILHPRQVLVSGPLIESDAYRNGIRDRITELHSSDFAKQRLQFFPLSSHGAAHSLAIYHSLVLNTSDRDFLQHAEGF
jgi:predicted NBD/HSP70 family sugar kinase